MKKIFLTTVIVLTLGIAGMAQSDGFFGSYSDGGSRTTEFPTVPSDAPGRITNDQNAYEGPLGSGLLILTALGAGYALRKKSGKKE